LRRARRSLGAWRDCDVLAELLERRVRRIRNPAERRAWEVVRDLALQKRERQMHRARRKLANRRLFTLAHAARKLIQHAAQPDDLQSAALGAMLVSSVRSAYAEWRAALARACESFDPADVHRFRIQSKRLRYRVELVRDLGDAEAEPALAWLKRLQDALGEWHDHAELARLAAQALADPRFLLEQPQAAAIVLRKLARDRAAMEERTRRLLTDAQQSTEASALHSWVSRYCAGAPQDTGEQPNP
jgi:CHAD domain-containing protein